mmetsp:Transcript_115155/g.320852  ORF Transcript_115155/g.320852 Transcript_115155/m.320852 type:complete len:201 (+) Transcript_115155:911-1513(+)
MTERHLDVSGRWTFPDSCRRAELGDQRQDLLVHVHALADAHGNVVPPAVTTLEVQRRTQTGEAAPDHDADAVAEMGSLVHVVRGEHDGAPLGQAAVHYAPQLAPRRRVDACRGLVQDCEARVTTECNCKLQFALVAARVCAARTVGIAGQVCHLEPPADVVGEVLFLNAADTAEEEQHLAPRETFVDGILLGHVSHVDKQ